MDSESPGTDNTPQRFARSVSGPKGSQSGINEKHSHIQGRGIISNIALGLSDGVTTNLAFLAGFSGAVSDLSVIRLAGVAAMLAGAISMFFGGLSAARSEHDLFKADSRREAHEIEHEPEEERQELMNFYLRKGLTREESEIVVKRITANKQKWLEDLLMHELHIHKEGLEHPIKVAAVVGLSFLLGAFVPLVGYLVFPVKQYAVILSTTSSLAFLFVAGGWKGTISGRNFWKAALELFLIGAAATVLLYAIGSQLVFA